MVVGGKEVENNKLVQTTIPVYLEEMFPVSYIEKYLDKFVAMCKDAINKGALQYKKEFKIEEDCQHFILYYCYHGTLSVVKYPTLHSKDDRIYESSASMMDVLKKYSEKLDKYAEELLDKDRDNVKYEYINTNDSITKVYYEYLINRKKAICTIYSDGRFKISLDLNKLCEGEINDDIRITSTQMIDMNSLYGKDTFDKLKFLIENVFIKAIYDNNVKAKKYMEQVEEFNTFMHTVINKGYKEKEDSISVDFDDHLH